MTGVGIEVGLNCLRLARLAVQTNQVQLVDAWEFPLSGGQEERWSASVAAQLREQVQKRRFHLDRAVVGLAGSWLNLRYLRLPRLSSARLAQAMALEVAQMREKNAADLSAGYLLLPPVEDKAAAEQPVLLALFDNRMFDRIRVFLRQAGVRAASFVPSPWGLHTAFAELTDYQEENCYLAQIDDSLINLAITSNKQLCFLRNADLQQLTIPNTAKEPGVPMPEETVKRPTGEIFNEPLNDDEDDDADDSPVAAGRTASDFLEASLKLARLQCKCTGLRIDRMLCAGDGATQKEFCLLLASRLHCTGQPMMLASRVASQLQGEAAKAFEKNPSRYMVALGLAHLASRHGAVPFAIASLTQQTRGLQLRRIFECASLALAVCGALIATSISFNAKKFQEKQYEQWQQKNVRLQEKMARLEAVDKQSQINEARLAALYQNILPNRRFLEIASWLHGHMPSPMYLTQLRCESGQDNKMKIVLGAVIEESSQDVYAILAEFRDALEKSQLAKIIEEKDPKFDEAEGKLHVEFRLAAPLIR